MNVIHAADVEEQLERLGDEAVSEGRIPLVVFPFETKDEVIREFARRLSFPEYFGRNLDALADALHDFLHALVGPTTLIVGVHPDFAETPDASVIEQILEDTEQDAGDIIPFDVVLVKPETSRTAEGA